MGALPPHSGAALNRIRAASCVAVIASIVLPMSCSTGPDEDSDVVQSVEVQPSSHTLNLHVNGTVQLTATARNRAGSAITGQAATWHSSASAVATVSAQGMVTAVGVGTTVVSASVNGIAGSSSITVQPAPVQSVQVVIDRPLLVVGGTAKATAKVTDATGQVVSDRQVTFASSNPAAATVSSDGTISAIGVGNLIISATSDSKTGQAAVCITETAPNLRVDVVTLSQSVQTLVGSIPLVSGGLPAIVRVHATNSIDLPPGCPLPRFRMIAYDGTTEALRAEAEAAGPLPRVTNLFSPVARFIVPSTLIKPSLRVLVEVDPSNAWAEANEGDNVWPSSGTPEQISFTDVPRLELTFIPVSVADGSGIGLVDDASLDTYLFGLRQMYPLSEIDYEVGAQLSSAFPLLAGSYDAWYTILSELNFRRVVEGSRRYYAGIVRPPATLPNTQLHGLGYIPTDLTTTEGATRTSVSLGMGWIWPARYISDVIAHELGHNHGRRHSPCGGAPGADPGFPYGDGGIGATGTDMYTYARNGTAPFDFLPATRSDFMSYCMPKWVSDYTYQALIAARKAAGPVAGVEARRVPCECLVVWGTAEGDSIAFNPAFVTKTFAQVPAGGGPWLIEGVRDDGGVAFSFAIEPTEIDHAPGVRHFAFTVPLSQADRSSLSFLRASGRGRVTTLQRTTASGRAALLTAATQASFRLKAGGQSELSWPSSVRAALVRSTTTGEVLAISRTGSVTLDARHVEVDLVLSDGVRSETVRIRRSSR